MDPKHNKNQALHEAILTADYPLVLKLLLEGANPNALNAVGQTPFDVLLSKPDDFNLAFFAATVTTLAMHGANLSDPQQRYSPLRSPINSPDRASYCHLFRATATTVTHTTLADTTLAAPQSKLREKFINLLLWIGINYGSIALLQLLLEKKLLTQEDLKNYSDPGKETISLTAARYGYIHLAEWLLERNIITDHDLKTQKDAHGNTTIKLAAIHGQIKFIQWLLTKQLISPFTLYTHQDGAVLHYTILDLVEYCSSPPLPAFRTWFTQWITSGLYDPPIQSLLDENLRPQNPIPFDRDLTPDETRWLEHRCECEITWITQCHTTFPNVVSREAADEAAITRYLHYQCYDAVGKLYERIRNDSTYTNSIRTTANLTLAEMLYNGWIDPPYANDKVFPPGLSRGDIPPISPEATPQEIVKHAALRRANLLTRVIPAYVYVIDLPTDSAQVLRRLFDSALAGMEFTSQHYQDYSLKTLPWREDAVSLFAAYYGEKLLFSRALALCLIEQQDFLLTTRRINNPIPLPSSSDTRSDEHSDTPSPHDLHSDEYRLHR